jgi:hypothetical protein
MKSVRIAALLMVIGVLGGLGRPAAAQSAVETQASAAPAAEPSPAPSPSPAATPAPVASPSPAPAVAALAAAGSETREPNEWKPSGDFRVRFERTSNQQPTGVPDVLEPRRREVVRLRAGVTRAFGSHVTFGARLRTGSADDPNSTDITLGDFGDSLEASLDRAYLELRYRGFFLTGGKFANPFLTSELVWDADVTPQGVAGSYAPKVSGPVSPKVVGMFYIVDEQSAGPDSLMGGAQAQLAIRASSALKVELGAGYYAYSIKSLRSADAGDTRSNRLAPGGLAYVSDFDLLDAVVAFEHTGFGKRYPVRLFGDFVHNLGADDQNQGFGVDLFVGRASERGDLRYRYGYAQAETDAVLAAFSHDNTTLATNYQQHTGTVDWQVRRNLQLNATYYLFRKLEVAAGDANPWISRLRLNALVSF